MMASDCGPCGESQRRPPPAPQAPPTFIDRLHTAGYNVSLHGKMHVGAGLDQYGPIIDFPFNAGARDSRGRSSHPATAWYILDDNHLSPTKYTGRRPNGSPPGLFCIDNHDGIH